MPFAGPLYKDVKRRLTEALTRGEWKPGDAIPAERLLSERCGTSIGTVRRAIDELVAENILIRQQGRGTYVASHNRDRLLFYSSTSSTSRESSDTPRSSCFRSPRPRRIAPRRML